MSKRTMHTQAIVDAMRDVVEGGVLTYEAIGNATKLEKTAYMPYVYSAIKIMLRSDRAVFKCVRGVGYKRLTPDEIVRSTNQCLRRLMRKTEMAAEMADPRTQAALRRHVRRLVTPKYSENCTTNE